MLDKVKIEELVAEIKKQSTSKVITDVVEEFCFKLWEMGKYPDEEWRDVVGYEGIYQVSNYGRVISYQNGFPHLLVAAIKKSGYSNVVLCKDAFHKTCRVHILVAQAFIPNPENKPFVNHKNGIKNDNRVENLEWVTQSENVHHALATGLMLNGSNSPIAKLTREDVIFIRENYKKGDKKFGGIALARKFNVDKGTIYNLIRYITYTDVE